MKITLIRPRFAKGYQSPARMEPLALGILAALTPKEHSVRAVDERFEEVPLSEPTDLVAISVCTFSAKRAYEIAASYRLRGVPVVLGGFHPTLQPEEAMAHADAVAMGDAEATWPQIVADAMAGRLQQVRSDLPAVTHVDYSARVQTVDRTGNPFIDQLTSTPLRVVEATAGDLIVPGTVYIAPGGYHLEVQRRGASLYTQLTTSEREHFQRPAVDVLFRSAAAAMGRNVAAALLTGMGRDGAEGMKVLKDAGARTIAQDEESSVVWGMPKAAIDLGAAEEVLGLDRIAPRLVSLVGEL